MITAKSKFILLFLILPIAFSFAGKLPASQATGIFVSAGVGPRLPVGSFASTTDLGYGLNLELSYTDSDRLPFFLFARFGYEQYPGSQGFYQTSYYSNYSTQSIPVQLGVRYYFSPLVEQVVLLMPVIELAGSYAFIKHLHEFKVGTGRTNFTEELSRFGFSGGVGVSMFLLEIMVSYHYFDSLQYLSMNLNVRLPLYINY
jgi:hypothetical protein